MAYKTESQVIDILQAMILLRTDMRTSLNGTFLTDVNGVLTTLDPGDPTDEDSATEQKVADLLAEADRFYNAIDDLIRTIIPHIGRLVSASDPNNPDIVLSALNDYLTTGGKSVLTQDFAAKFTSLTPGGSNVGTGKTQVLNTDGQSLDMNISHVETLTFKCIQDATQGAVAGRELFSVQGTQAANLRAWQRGGSGLSSQYVGAYGNGVNEWPPTIKQVQAQYTCIGASSAAGNLVTNGDFEQPIVGTGTAKLPGWTLNGSHAVVVQASTAGTDLINGAYCIKTTGTFSMYQNDLTSKLKQGVPIGLSIKGRPINGGAGTVTFTGHVKVMSTDDATTYATHTFTNADFTVNVNGQTTPTLFVLPVGAKPCKVVVDITAMGGTAATPTLALDDVIVSEASIVDGGRAIAIHDGSNINDSGMLVGRFKFNDLFTGATTAPTVGEMQRIFNELFGRYVKHANPAVTWSDS